MLGACTQALLVEPVHREGYGCSHHGIQSAVWPAWSREHFDELSCTPTQHSNYNFLEKVQQTQNTSLFYLCSPVPHCVILCLVCMLSLYISLPEFKDMLWGLATAQEEEVTPGSCQQVKLIKICFFRSLACVVVPNTILMGHILVCRTRKGTSQPHTNVL